MDESSPAPALPPPGWYPAADGRLWWWDGGRWLLPAPDRPVDPALGVLPHVAFFVVPVVGAVAVLLTAGRRDEFVRHHAAEAVNAQIWFLLASAIGVVAWVATVLVTVATQQEAVMAFGALVWVWLAVVMVSATVLSIIGAVRAGRREWWCYPGLPHRFVAGARTGR